MKKNSFHHSLSLSQLKRKALRWAAPFSPVCFLDNNEHHQLPHHQAECLLAVGAANSLKAMAGQQAFVQLQTALDQQPGWWFGYLGYDLKNEVEDLSSGNPDSLGLPDLHFFQPEILLRLTANAIHIESAKLEPEVIWNNIQQIRLADTSYQLPHPPEIKARIPRETYLQKVDAIRQHIQLGDIYEMNFCQEFYATDCSLEPLPLFETFNQKTRTPFAAYYQFDDFHLLSASPERFLQKTGRRLLSQPIKGTIRRGSDATEDQLLREQLRNSPKDRAENVMIVDLVRNDLARVSETGSVKVDELFGIYGFEQVYQMISTVSAVLRADVHPVEAIRALFPMGSMTGAPKVRSMQLIETFETRRRGLYSGAVGYFTPERDFDFNVVIRSMVYNAQRKYLSFQVGGAIVYDSIPEKEYEECLLKISGILQTLNGFIQQP